MHPSGQWEAQSSNPSTDARARSDQRKRRIENGSDDDRNEGLLSFGVLTIYI